MRPAMPDPKRDLKGATPKTLWISVLAFVYFLPILVAASPPLQEAAPDLFGKATAIDVDLLKANGHIVQLRGVKAVTYKRKPEELEPNSAHWSSLPVWTRKRAGKRSTASVTVASRDLPLMARPVTLLNRQTAGIPTGRSRREPICGPGVCLEG